MSELYAIHRPELTQINTNFNVGSGMSIGNVDIGPYNTLAFIAKVDSGNATLDIRLSPTSAMTIATSIQLALSDGVTSVASIPALVGRYMDITVSGINSNAAVQIFGYGVQI